MGWEEEVKGVNCERQEEVGLLSPGVPSPMFYLEAGGEEILNKVGAGGL